MIAIYRSPGVPIRQFCAALREVLALSSTQLKILIGDFNVNWFNVSEREPLYNLLVRDNHYRQLISSYITDSKTCIDHIYSNLPETQVKVHTLKTLFL